MKSILIYIVYLHFLRRDIRISNWSILKIGILLSRNRPKLNSLENYQLRSPNFLRNFLSGRLDTRPHNDVFICAISLKNAILLYWHHCLIDWLVVYLHRFFGCTAHLVWSGMTICEWCTWKEPIVTFEVTVPVFGSRDRGQQLKTCFEFRDFHGYEDSSRFLMGCDAM
jgi:hypothetical protein